MKKKFVGMDLGTDEIRVAVVDPDDGKVSPAFYVNWNADEKGIDGEREALVKKVNDVANFDDLILSFPANKIFSHYIELPILAGEQLQTALNTRIRKFFPFDDKRHSLTDVEVPPLSGDSKKRGHMAFVVIKQGVDNQVSLMKSLAMKVTHIDIPHNGLTRWLLWEDKNLEKGNHLFILLHKDFAIIGAFKDKMLYYVGALKPPLFNLEVWRNMKVDSLKPLEPFVENLSNEIKSIIYYIRFRLAPVEVRIDDIILIGECHTDDILKSYLEKDLKIPVIVKEPAKLKFDDSIPVNQRALYTTAAGLSLRVLEESIWAQ